MIIITEQRPEGFFHEFSLHGSAPGHPAMQENVVNGAVLQIRAQWVARPLEKNSKGDAVLNYQSILSQKLIIKGWQILVI